MKFRIHPLIDGKRTSFQVEKIPAPEDRERYLLSGANRSVTLETNRLLFKKKGLKRRKGDWSVVEGSLRNAYALDKICAEIEKADPL